MYYGIMRHPQSNKIMDFIVDENDLPIEWETEQEAYDALKDHAYFSVIDIIEID